MGESREQHLWVGREVISMPEGPKVGGAAVMPRNVSFGTNARCSGQLGDPAQKKS